jgi:hypothetical protein
MWCAAGSKRNTIRLGAVRTSYEHHTLVEHRVPVVDGTSAVVCRLHPFITHPAREVNIRSCEPATFQVIVEAFASHSSSPDTGTGGLQYQHQHQHSTTVPGHGSESVLGGSVLGHVGYSRAFFELHEGAIYLHQGRQYLVTHLCLQALFAKCIPVRVPYYTAAHNDFQIDILRQLHGNEVCGFGMVTVKSNVSGYSKVFRDSGGSGRRSVWGGECSLPQLVSE